MNTEALLIKREEKKLLARKCVEDSVRGPRFLSPLRQRTRRVYFSATNKWRCHPNKFQPLTYKVTPCSSRGSIEDYQALTNTEFFSLISTTFHKLSHADCVSLIRLIAYAWIHVKHIQTLPLCGVCGLAKIGTKPNEWNLNYSREA